MDISQFAGFGGFPIVVGIVQLFKNTFPQAPAWATVLCAFVGAEAWGAGAAYALCTDVVTSLLIGVVVWLMAMGAWSGGKAVLGK